MLKLTHSSLENLFMRYEEPSSMVRWDAPLLTVLWDEADIPGDQVWDAINKGNVKPPNSGTLSNAKAPADALQTLEKVTAAITTAVASESSSQSSGSTMVVSVGDAQVSINLPGRNITLSELQRHRRQFVSVHKKAITLGTTERGGVDWSEENIGVKFGTYLEEHL
ncbi:hypothetical protein D9613_000643 [Agrocybe pediades]|uniref:Uncharacterized protein n=1 Tax=Agrocybe pediades TaxID=84607 RepID=A0A8H4QZP0_9AGAR|nr:hypothetical protein D9613_000643 [Agrocybe pediades]